MSLLSKSYLAVLFGCALSTVGCCYHAEHFGRTRDIGLGEIGCGTCSRSRCGSQGVSCPTGAPCGQVPEKHASSDQGLPTIATEEPPSTVIPIAYKESADGGKMKFRRTESSARELPVYVQSPESLSDAPPVNPNPVATIKSKIIP